MESEPQDRNIPILLALAICLTIYLFVIRSLFLFIPVFAGLLYLLWKRGGGSMERWEEEDPADWWKKGSRSEEQ